MVCLVDGCGVNFRRGEKEGQENKDLERHLQPLKDKQQQLLWNLLENPVRFFI